VNVVAVPGEMKDHKVLVYALSTCVWCKRTKEFLKDRKVHYEYVDVDLASPEDRKRIDDRRLIVGFKLDDLKEALELR